MELDVVKLKEIKPVLGGYIREALELLNASPAPDDKAVHDIRVLMKKSRAVMKLLASQVDKDTFSKNYEAFRDVGRIMATWRDTSVLRKTLRDIKKEYPSIFENLRNNEKLAMLMKKPADEIKEGEELKDIADNKSVAEILIPEDIKNKIESVNELLSKAGYRLRFLNLENIDPRILLKDLENSYNTVIDCYVKCRNITKPPNIHEFRKRSKDFLYQLYFFRPLNPEAIKSIEKKLDAMTQNLGRYNDLNQVINELSYNYKDPTNIPAAHELMIVIKEEQDRYLSKVWPVAYKLFCPGQKLVNILGFRILII